MKKIINGKMYNTETAVRIGYYSNGDDYGDCHWYEEVLYRKKTGQFFLYGSGGALTCYAECTDSDGRWHRSGDAIVPLSIEQARQWAEDYLAADDYIELFGEVPE